VVATVNQELVTLARQSRGLTQDGLRKLTGIQQWNISKIESGLRQPTESELHRLAEALDYPETFFTQHWRPEGPGVTEYYHRKRQRATAKQLDRIYAIAAIQQHNVATLLRSAEVGNVAFPSFPLDEYDEDAAATAGKVRAVWNLPRGPVHDLTGLIESPGGIVLQCDFQTRHVDGFSRRPATGPPIFYMSDNLPPDRWRWTLSHELGHVVMHTVPNPEMEDQANLFASAFLMPAREIKQDLWNLSFENLSRLKIKWKVSVQALIMRAYSLNVITDSRRRYLFMQWSKAGNRTREPEHLDPPVETPKSVANLIDFHRRQLEYSEADLCTALKLNENDLRERYMTRSAFLRLVK